MQQSIAEKASCRKYKKRHRKELSADEVEKIVGVAQQPFRRQKDVAQQFRVTVQLVGALCREAAKAPEKQTEKRRQELLASERREAIECWNEIAANEFGNQRSCRRLAAFSDACDTRSAS